MARCTAITKEGAQCQLLASEGRDCCHVHLKQSRRLRLIKLSSIGGTLLVIVAVVANFAQISQWLGISPPKLTSQLSSTELIENLLDVSEVVSAKRKEWVQLEEYIRNQEQMCKEGHHDLGEIRCWVVLGQWYSAANKNRQALQYFTRAYEINPKIADPYYARGNVYYELALIDLIRKQKFSIDSDKLDCVLTPDEQSKVLFSRVMNEYEQGERYPTVQDIDPSSRLMVTSLHVVGHRKRQIMDVTKGGKTIRLHRLELLRLMTWIPAIYPDDKALNDRAVKLTENLFSYMKKHPEEFPYLLLPKLSEEEPQQQESVKPNR